MKFKYQFDNCEVSEIEVPEEWANILFYLDRQEYNNNQKETRRHTTLDNRNDGGIWLAVEDKNIAAIFADESNEEKLHMVLKQLKPAQQKLIKYIFFEGVSVNDYAKLEGVDQSAISHRLQTIYKKITKLF